MLDHFRRILLVVAIFFVSGLLYKQWRDGNGGFGFFDIFTKKEDPQAYTTAPASVLKAGDLPGLTAFSAESAKLAQAVLPSVVSIDTATVERKQVGLSIFNQNIYQNRVVPSLGSGVIVSKEGHIVTNYHVVKDAAQILVTTNDQKTYEGKLIGADTQLDVAVIKIVSTTGKDFQPLSFGDSDAAKVGQVVFAVGNPFGLSGSVTQGIISATQRRFSDTTNDVLQTDTVINPGNSGGPLVNIFGEIVGINFSIFTGDEKVYAWQGVGLAIPSNDVRASFQAIMQRGLAESAKPQAAPQIGYLGITLQQRTVTIGNGFGSTLGVIVAEVQDGSPAMEAGLKPGDVIGAVNGEGLESPDQLFLVIRGTPPGKQVAFTVVRNNKPETLTATIKPRPQG